MQSDKNLEIKSLSGFDNGMILDAFERAFGGYAVKFDRQEVEAMFRRRGFEASLSFAAFRGDEIVAFTFNGFGSYNGKLTCYDCATGTLPDFRGQGLAGQIFNYALPYLKEAKVEQYLLEVLKSNDAAISVYKSNGFEITADYDCFNQEKDKLAFNRKCDFTLKIKPIAIGDLATMVSLCDFTPSWQNGIESLLRGEDGLICHGAFIDDRCVGYCVVDPLTGDISQIAVEPLLRRHGIATALLAEAVSGIESLKVKCLNVVSSCLSLHGFLASVNIAPGLSQYEMVRRL